MNIQQIAHSSPSAKEVFNVLERRQRSRKRTDLNRIYREIKLTNTEISKKEVLIVFKKLQDAGVGSIVFGRGSNPNRFVWNYSLRDIAKAAFEKDKKAIAPAPSQPAQQTKVATTNNTIQITMQIPANVSIEELKAFLELGANLKAGA